MKIDPNARYDSETGELIVKGEFCQYGLCPCCSGPNFEPRKFKHCWFCSTCIKERLTDCSNIECAFNKLIELQKSNKKPSP